MSSIEDVCRLPTIPASQYDADQRQAAADFEKARHRPVFGPFEPMMHSPHTMTLARAMGDYFRYQSAVGNTLSELAILMTARQWSQGFEWSVHYPAAVAAAIDPAVADAIGQGCRPVRLTDDEAMVYDFVNELLTYQQVADATYASIKSRFGEKGVVDLTGIVGYYSFLAMQLNVARYQVPGDAPQLPPRRSGRDAK